MKKVRINRKRWLRGPVEHNIPTALWFANLKAGCCLGHACKQISRLTEKQLEAWAIPSQVFKGRSFFTVIDKIVNDKPFVREAMKANDQYGLSDAEREKRLIAIFKNVGVKLEFYGEGVPGND